MMKVSVIVTSYNNSHVLAKCLDALVGQEYDRTGIELEIIIVDSGSTDNSMEILESYGDAIKLVINPEDRPHLSPAEARNAGVARAEGEVLIFSDSDCVVPPDWVARMVGVMRETGAPCVIGNREPDYGEMWGTFVRRYNFIIYSNKFTIEEPVIMNEATLAAGRPIVLLAANNFAIKSSVWNETGGMRSVFKNPSGEDLLMEIEIIKAGYDICFDPRVRVSHYHPISLKSMIHKSFYRGESTYLIKKHSDGYFDWRCIVDRGNMVDPGRFCLGAFSYAAFIAIVSSCGFSAQVTMAAYVTPLSVATLVGIVRKKKRLDTILAAKGEVYRRDYALSLFDIFLFNQLEFVVNITNTANFTWCNLLRR